MGSEKYPTENDFSSFVTKRGGTYNAFTMEERTCFFFDCLEKHLKETLDRFAQFFIAPLLDKEAMTRERQAVDSEFQMATVSDWCRREQLFVSLAKDDSPVNTFTYGNLKTLKDNIEDDKLHQAVHEFRERHYSAHRMTLAVQTRLSMQNIQNLVLECFSTVPNNSIPKDDFSFAVDTFDTPEFNRIYYIKPIDETIEMYLKWSVPPLYHKYKTKTLWYLGNVIGDESKGSLLSYLKKRVWATDLCFCADENSIYSIATCSINLTEEGSKHLFDIIDAVFSYINLVRKLGPQEYLFDDLKSISDNSFKFSTEVPAQYTVLRLEEPMHRYPPEHFLTGDNIHYEFDPNEIKTATDHLVPDKVNISIINKNLPDGLKFSKVEPWFRAEYIDLPITDDLKLKWDSIEPYDEFEIPAPNPYLTKDFDLLPEEANHPEYPQKIVSTDKYELWYRKDQKFKLPFANYNIYLISPLFIESPKNSALTELLTSLISFTLNEETYAANKANLYSYIYFYDKGITITVQGYNEKLPVLMDVIGNYIVNLMDYITEKMFLELKEQALKEQYNMIRSPYSLACDTHNKILINHNWTPIEKYNALLDLTYEDLLGYIDNYRKELYAKVLVQGNVTLDVATNAVQSFINVLQFDPLPEDKYPQTVVAKFPIGEKCLYLQSFNKQDSNSVVENYYQVGTYSLRDTVISDLLMLMMQEPSFDILRTKEQLGYSVFCSNRKTEGVLMFNISVTSQAHKFTTEHVDSRIEAFMKHSQKILEDTTDTDFQQIKNDYIKTKECVDLQLSEEFNKNWTEIYENTYMFDRAAKEVATAKEITLDEFRNWWDKHNHFGSRENFRKLSLQVEGHVQETNDDAKDETKDDTRVDELYGKPISLIYLGNNEENKKDDPEYYIEDIYEFREKLDSYPPKLLTRGP